jgi:hypothetical protein
MSDTGDVHVVEFVRGPGRPRGTTYDNLDTGPCHDLHRLLAEQPHLPFGTVARFVADDIYNARYIACVEHRVKRLRRSYPRWLNAREEFLSRD